MSSVGFGYWLYGSGLPELRQEMVTRFEAVDKHNKKTDDQIGQIQKVTANNYFVVFNLKDWDSDANNS